MQEDFGSQTFEHSTSQGLWYSVHSILLCTLRRCAQCIESGVLGIVTVTVIGALPVKHGTVLAFPIQPQLQCSQQSCI